MGDRGTFVVRTAVVGVALAVLFAACGSSGSNKGGGSSGTTTPQTAPFSKTLGTGVTATTIKVGVMMIDQQCIAQYENSLEYDQQKDYDLFINNINDNGGINGRKIVPVYKTYCPPPLRQSEELNACTSLTDDNHVFAAIGTFYDTTGDAQLCFIKQHHTVVVADSLTDALVAKGPPGYLVASDIAPERRLNVIMSLLKTKNILAGKTVGTVTTAANKSRVTKVVDPGLQALGVKRGGDAILTIASSDLTDAQAQLDSFIERWKSDHTNALLMIGDDVSSTMFVEKIKKAIPDMLIVADTTSIGDQGQNEQKAHVTPNPYDGAITAEGLTGLEHSKTDHYKFCAGIWQKANPGQPAPLPNVVIKRPDGHQDNKYGAMEDACLFTNLFATIARKVGPYLNNDNWVRTVDSFGPIDDTSTNFASIHAGKYDADDTYGLVSFDPTIPPNGDWVHVTPEVNVGNT